MSIRPQGRLVLADAIAYTEDRFQPEFIVDLATLTGGSSDQAEKLWTMLANNFPATGG